MSDTVEGKKHDKKIADEENIMFEPGSVLMQDTGFQGYAPENVETKQPKKKTKKIELTPEEKEKNRELSSERVAIEHCISGIKRLRIVKDTIRKSNYELRHNVMVIACALHNLRVKNPLRLYQARK